MGTQTPAEPVLEFGWDDDRSLSGRRRSQVKTRKQTSTARSFDVFDLSVPVLRGIKRKGYTLPTPIQRRVLPLILQGQDVVGMARTGSGKTAAFVIPLLERLKTHSPRAGARALVLAPTRELALQTCKVVKELGRFTNLRTAILVGGDSMEAQFAELAANPDIIVSTPGRLMHHLQEVEGMTLRTVEYLVFDEADRLFELGFAEQLSAIMHQMSGSRQTMLFSATLPRALAEFARAGLREPELVRLDSDTKISPDLQLAFFTARSEEKVAALLHLVREVVEDGQPTLIFVSTRHHVELVQQLLTRDGAACAAVYGAMDQSARKINVAKFRAGKMQFLVVTDIAARGIDIPLLDNIINFDFPPQPKLFVHRVGRAARAGRSGTAYSLVTAAELPYLLDLHLFLSRPVHPAPMRSLHEAAAAVRSSDSASSIYGTFPQVVLENAIQRASSLLEDDDLKAQQKSAANAFMLYQKTRPGASPESVHRARALPKEGVHPLLAAGLPAAALATGGLESQAALAEITAGLQSYRPAQTVFEADISHASMLPSSRRKRRRGMAGVKLNEKVDVMRQKRAAHAGVIAASKTRQEDMEAMAPDAEIDSAALRARRPAARQCAALGDGHSPWGRYRDDDFYISSAKGNRHEDRAYAVRSSGLDDAVLDLTGEDAGGMTARSKQYHWDKRHKRYVKLQPGEELKPSGKRMKTESGAKRKPGRALAGGMYQKWVKQQHRKVLATGQSEGTAAPQMAALADRFKKGGRWAPSPRRMPTKAKGGTKPLPVSGVELKTPDQVRKQRKSNSRKTGTPSLK